MLVPPVVTVTAKPLRQRRRARVAGVCAALFACLAFFGPEASVAQEAKTGVMNPEAIDAFKRMSKQLGKAKTLSFTSSSLYEVVDPSGIKDLHARTTLVVLQRPNRLYARTRRDDGSRSRIWFDGQTLSVAVEGTEGVRYATLPAPKGAKTIDGMLDHASDEYDFVLQLGDLLYSDVYGTFEDALLSAEHLGKALVGGRPCHHLSLELTGADAQLWVQDGDDPQPCRFAFSLKGTPSEPLFVSNFDSWLANPDVAAVSFSFTAPAGAKKVELKELVKEAGAH